MDQGLFVHFFCMDTQPPVSFIEKSIVCPTKLEWHLWVNHVTVCVGLFLNSVLYCWFVCPLPMQHHLITLISRVTENFSELPTLAIFSKLVWTILHPLYFHRKFRLSLSVSSKTGIWLRNYRWIRECTWRMLQ